MSRLSWIPAALFIVAAPLFLVTASVAWAFNSPGVYERGFEKYRISAVTGITETDLEQVASDIRGYFNSRQEPLELRTRVFGREMEIFKPVEVIHMKDVKRLVWGVYIVAVVSVVYLLAVIGAVVLKHRGRSREILSHWVLRSGGLTVAIIVAVGLFALVGFDTLFLKFHQLFFTNDFWQLDIRTDYLVMLFPQDFWFDATMWVATRAGVGAVIVSALSGGYLLYLRSQAQKRIPA